ncbi:MAG TPA: methyltransferase domain-containing protein [Bacteroidia bacterium]|nr:methyltransferase domain-containing protein [Bacteroidia bacterium]
MTTEPAVAIDFYESGEYLKKHPDWHSEDADWKARNILKIISRNNLAPKAICEIGCGSGEILNVLHGLLSESVSFSGFDISPQAITLASKREKSRLHFELKALEAIPATRSFDLGLMIDVFEHVEDFYGFIRKSRDTSRQMIFHIPLDISVQSIIRVRPLQRKREKSGHIHFFTKETALAALRDSGYRVIDHFYTGSYTERPARTVLSAIAKIPRKLFFAIHRDLTVRWLGGYSLMVLAEPGK